MWRSYLAVRSEEASGNATAVKSKKRAKPAKRNGALLQVQTPPIEPGTATTERVRSYWEQLTPAERQQVLFVDDPDLVKQLYKLNLSLLCVGLMQRHLKANARSTTSSSTAEPKATSETQPVPLTATKASATAADVAQSKPANAQARPLLSSSNDPTEKTYELLEAMEFMDIGTGRPGLYKTALPPSHLLIRSISQRTGILTVKNELVESTERLFSLVGDVLNGFLSSLYVLTDSHFQKLFVTESEVINTWEDYQKLIGMLVEQVRMHSTCRLYLSKLTLSPPFS